MSKYFDILYTCGHELKKKHRNFNDKRKPQSNLLVM